jgi:NHL repeat
MTAGDIYTIAGTGAYGFSGDGGLAVKAKLGFPSGITVDQHGNVLVLDALSRRVRVIAASTGTFYGAAMTADHIYTVVGDGNAAFNGDGIPARKAGLAGEALATDAAGNLIIADNHFRVRLVAVRTGIMYGQQMTAGDIYTIAGDGVQGTSGSGSPAREAEFELLGGVTADAHGNVIVTDAYTGVVWVVAVTNGTFYGQQMTAGDVYAIAGGGATLGDGGPATSAFFNSPLGVAVTSAGSVLVTDGYDNLLRAISP